MHARLDSSNDGTIEYTLRYLECIKHCTVNNDRATERLTSTRANYKRESKFPLETITTTEKGISANVQENLDR